MNNKQFLISYSNDQDRHIFYIFELELISLLKLFSRDAAVSNLHFFIESGIGNNYKCFSSESNPDIQTVGALIQFLENVYYENNDLRIFELELDLFDKELAVVIKENAIDIVFFSSKMTEKNMWSLINKILHNLLLVDNTLLKGIKSLLMHNQQKILVFDLLGNLLDTYDTIDDFRISTAKN